MKKVKRTSPKSLKNKAAQNSVDPNQLLAGVFGSTQFGTAPLSQPFELSANNAYTPVTLNRILLSYSYMTHGIIQTFIDQPVEDAFRGGLILKSNELDAEDLEKLNKVMYRCGDYRAMILTMQWAKLYGGAGLIINTDQDPEEELDVDAINEDTPLEFLPADRWELVLNSLNSDSKPCPYNYYGQSLHKSRVVKVMGKDAPSYIRSRLQGWGMSELERMIRPLNAFVKNEDVIYELLDEAKVDVWKIMNFNSQMLSQAAAGKTHARLQIANLMKNYMNAVVMDKEDDYDQKQIAFSGLPEILNQNRIGAAAAARMPMTKLFGLSATGFNAGEDDIENYNALIESEVRSKAEALIHEILPLRAKQVFGFIPNIEFEFFPLRILSAEQEENVKNQKFNRISSLYSQGMLTAKEYMEALRDEKIYMKDTEVGEGVREPEVPTSSSEFDKPQAMVPKTVSEEKV